MKEEDAAVDHDRCYNFHKMLFFNPNFFSENLIAILFFINMLVSIWRIGTEGWHSEIGHKSCVVLWWYMRFYQPN